MIQEIVNYIKHLKKHSPIIFEEGLKLSKGLHILVELDENGNPVNFPGKKGENWDYYDGKSETEFLKGIKIYEQYSQRIGADMNKVFDKKKQIFSCSPFVLSFKTKTLKEGIIEKNIIKDSDKEKEILALDSSDITILNKEDIKKNYQIKGISSLMYLLDFYFQKAKQECIDENDEMLIKIDNFKKFIKVRLYEIIRLYNLKKEDFINIYLDIDKEEYKKAYENYLKRNLFNKNDFNTDEKITDETYGLSGFLNGLNEKKPFLKHFTSPLYKGISYRIKSQDAIYLNDFLKLLSNRVFPSPLPIFIDEGEFKNLDEIIAIFKKDKKLTFTQIIKKLFDENPQRILQNYYLLFFIGQNLKDFDYVPKFRYWLGTNGNYPVVKNIFQLKESGELIKNKKIKHIFEFEKYIVKTIFNNSLVKINEKTNEITLKYFDDIKLKYVIGGEPVFLMILKYRKAFYDYIYKSKTSSITYYMWDEILWNSIIADLRDDKLEKSYHTREWNIKEKLNIWFSFYNFFGKPEGRIDMGSKIQEFIEKTRKIANDDNEHLETIEEAMFAAGQIIFYLLNQSKSSEKTHALLEPFLQKSSLQKLQDSISNTFNMYKHEINFGHGRFERLMKEVLGFEYNGNIKDFQRILLAGYFSEPVIYEKKEKKEENYE